MMNLMTMMLMMMAVCMAIYIVGNTNIVAATVMGITARSNICVAKCMLRITWWLGHSSEIS